LSGEKSSGGKWIRVSPADYIPAAQRSATGANAVNWQFVVPVQRSGISPEKIMKRQGFPLRRSLFYGLTLLLVCVFIYLAVQGHRQEKQRQERGADMVETFQPTPMRVLAPQDLEITASSITLDRQNSNEEGPTDRHRIEIRNSGNARYCDIQLKLEYFGSGGAKLGSVERQVTKEIPPGKTLLEIDIRAADLPAGAVSYEPAIVYADIDSLK
jgi:hypothetical protein